MVSDRIPVLLDTDIGSDIDDALALAYLLCEPRCELLGVTTVTGEPERRAEMVSAMCRHAGRDDIPIHVGLSAPMLVPQAQPQAPQAAALGARPRAAFGTEPTAVEFLRRAIRARPGEIALLAIGPLTNVGALFAVDPEIPALLRALVLMCGRFFTAMGGEWNAICDPHATAIVYGGGTQRRSPLHVSYGLDVTTQCRMPADECRRRFTARVLEPVRDFAEVWFERRSAITFHDPLAAVGIFDPNVCGYCVGEVAVALSPPTAGWTVLRRSAHGSGPHRVAETVDAARFFERFFATLR